MLARLATVSCRGALKHEASTLRRGFAGVARFSPKQFEEKFSDHPDILSMYRTKRWMNLYDKLQEMKMGRDEVFHPQYINILCG